MDNDEIWTTEEMLEYGEWRCLDKKRNGGTDEDAFDRWINER